MNARDFKRLQGAGSALASTGDAIAKLSKSCASASRSMGKLNEYFERTRKEKGRLRAIRRRHLRKTSDPK